VVVKEIEVPFGMVELVAASMGGEVKRRGKAKVEDVDEDTDTGSWTVETESPSDTDGDDLSGTVVLERDALFAMDLESDLDEPASQPRFAIDLEIASVFKPRPVRTRVHNHLHVAGNAGGKNKKPKKPKHLMPLNGNGHGVGSGMGNGDATENGQHHKHHNRRQARDKKREEKRRALTAFAAQVIAGSGQDAAVDPDSSAITASSADLLVHGLEQMHVTIEEPATLTVPPSEGIIANSSEGMIVGSEGMVVTSEEIIVGSEEVIAAASEEIIVSSSESFALINAEVNEVDEDEDGDDDDDVFAAPTTATPFSTFLTAPGGESFLNVPAEAFLDVPATARPSFASPNPSGMAGGRGKKGETRLIVEALVVRKMSLEEAFLDFGGFSLT